MNILFVGLGGVPFKKRACDLRLISFAKLFVSIGCKVTILNRYPYKKVNNGNLNISKGISIIELFNNEQAQNTVSILMNYCLSLFLEPFKIIQLNKLNKINYLHLYSGHFIDLVFYKIAAKIIKAKVIYQYVEMRSSVNRSGIYHKLNNFLCDKYGCKFFDGAICISSYIENRVQLLSKKLATIKIPPICDISFYEKNKIASLEFSYILLCCNTGYNDTIKLVIDAYENSRLKDNNIKLVLVLSGVISECLINDKNENIIIYQDLDYEELVSLYKSADALLIPLRNTIQDIARFPNKICEYVSSGGIIITNNIGEICYYFKDEVNALFAKDYTVNSYTIQMNKLLTLDKIKKEKMKKETIKLALNAFDIKTYADSMKVFLNKLNY